MLCFSKKGLRVDDDPPLIPKKQSRNLLRKIRDKVFRKGKNNPKNSPPKPLPTNSPPIPIPPLPNNAHPNPTIPTTSQPNPPLPGRRFEMTLDITKPYPLYNAMNGINSNAKNAIPSDPKNTIIFSTSCSNFLRVEELEVSEGIQNEKESESNSQRNTGELIEVQDCIEKEQGNGSIEEVTNLLPLDTTDETNRKTLKEVEVPEGIEAQGNNSEYERNTVTHERPLEITTDDEYRKAIVLYKGFKPDEPTVASNRIIFSTSCSNFARIQDVTNEITHDKGEIEVPERANGKGSEDKADDAIEGMGEIDEVEGIKESNKNSIEEVPLDKTTEESNDNHRGYLLTVLTGPLQFSLMNMF